MSLQLQHRTLWDLGVGIPAWLSLQKHLALSWHSSSQCRNLRKSTRARCPLAPVCRAMQTVVCANNWDLLLVPGAEISQSCAFGWWWARDDRRPKGGAHTHVGSKAPGANQLFVHGHLPARSLSVQRGGSTEQLLVLLRSTQ